MAKKEYCFIALLYIGMIIFIIIIHKFIKIKIRKILNNNEI